MTIDIDGSINTAYIEKLKMLAMSIETIYPSPPPKTPKTKLY